MLKIVLACIVIAGLLLLIAPSFGLALPAVAQETPRPSVQPPTPRPSVQPPPRPTHTPTPTPSPIVTPSETATPPGDLPIVPEASTLLLLGTAISGLATYLGLQARARRR